jgi:predicted transposase YbfD/YdcC
MREKWLSKFLALREGIPKHDVYRRVLCAIRSELLEACFVNWVRDIKQNIQREVIAIADCIITIDAMGCQYEIADKIVKKGADYVFSLKGNQETLHDAVEEYWDMLDFNKPEVKAKYIRFRSVSTYEEKHGRKESRDYAVSDDVQWLHEQFPKWKTINSIGVVESTRDTGEEVKTERRYFVSSLGADEEQFAYAVRAHWGIENRLHYMLDVIYREDACRVRKDYSPRTLALIRKIALTIARSDKESKTSIRGRVQQMAWSEDYLESLLFRSDFASVQEAS